MTDNKADVQPAKINEMLKVLVVPKKESPWATKFGDNDLAILRENGIDLGGAFSKTAKPLTGPEKMGLGKAEYKKLMEEQTAWEITPAESSRPLISPVELHNQKMEELQQKLKKTDAEFANLKADQSNWEDARDSGGPYSKSSPFKLADMQAGNTGNKLDQMIKDVMGQPSANPLVFEPLR